MSNYKKSDFFVKRVGGLVYIGREDKRTKLKEIVTVGSQRKLICGVVHSAIKYDFFSRVYDLVSDIMRDCRNLKKSLPWTPYLELFPEKTKI